MDSRLSYGDAAQFLQRVTLQSCSDLCAENVNGSQKLAKQSKAE